MIEVRPFETLGRADHGWLKANHHFSFAHYFDPSRMSHGALRVWNDDEIAPNTGFPPHECPATQALQTKMPKINILVLTVSDNEADLFAAMKFGATGYILKNTEPEELILSCPFLAPDDYYVAVTNRTLQPVRYTLTVDAGEECPVPTFRRGDVNVDAILNIQSHSFREDKPGELAETGAKRIVEFLKKQKGVKVEIGRTYKLDVVMETGAIRQEVVVTGQAPVIDVRRSSTTANISKQVFDKLPKGRNFTSVITTQPGLNSEAEFGGGYSFDGASSSENTFYVDGVDTTTLYTGDSGQSVNFDFIEEIQVKSSGYAAE